MTNPYYVRPAVAGSEQVGTKLVRVNFRYYPAQCAAFSPLIVRCDTPDRPLSVYLHRPASPQCHADFKGNSIDRKCYAHNQGLSECGDNTGSVYPETRRFSRWISTSNHDYCEYYTQKYAKSIIHVKFPKALYTIVI